MDTASTKVAEVEEEEKKKKEETISDDSSTPANGFPKPEELVAKAIAPVKRDYLRPPPARPSSKDDRDKEKGLLSDKKNPVVKEKKSKRQLKRERQQVLLSMICLKP